jgi:hypothetical protein
MSTLSDVLSWAPLIGNKVMSCIGWWKGGYMSDKWLVSSPSGPRFFRRNNILLRSGIDLFLWTEESLDDCSVPSG